MAEELMAKANKNISVAPLTKPAMAPKPGTKKLWKTLEEETIGKNMLSERVDDLVAGGGRPTRNGLAQGEAGNLRRPPPRPMYWSVSSKTASATCGPRTGRTKLVPCMHA